MPPISLFIVVIWLTAGVVALLGVIAGINATNSTLTLRRRWLAGIGSVLAALLLLVFFAGGGQLLVAALSRPN